MAFVQSRTGPGKINNTLSNNLLRMSEQKLKNSSSNKEAMSQSKADGDTRLNLGKIIEFLFGAQY